MDVLVFVIGYYGLIALLTFWTTKKGQIQGSCRFNFKKEEEIILDPEIKLDKYWWLLTNVIPMGLIKI